MAKIPFLPLVFTEIIVAKLKVWLPMRATPNQEIPLAMLKKTKPRRLCVSHSPFSGGQFLLRGDGSFQVIW